MTSAARRLRILLLSGLALAGAAGAAGALAQAADPEAALDQGNRLFRRGEREAALAAYAEGWNPDDPHPLLGYNLGATAHRLGRLPEAILWYRRAEEAGLRGDPWLRENLALARAELGLPEGGAPPAPGVWRRLTPEMRWAAVALAWAALLVLAAPRLPRPWRRAGTATLAALSLGAFLAAALLDRFGPRPVVLLAGCNAADPATGGLPPGSEAWAVPHRDGGGAPRWRIVGLPHPLECPAEALGWVEPRAEI